MASVSVVGQHRLDSEPQLFLFKLTSVGKKISPLRKSSRGKMMLRRGSHTTGGEAVAQRLAPEPAGATALNGTMMPGDGCGAPVVPAAPRSPDREREAGSTDRDKKTGTGTRDGGTGHVSSDCNSNNNCDSNHNTGGRRGSSCRKSDTDATTNGHRGAHRHRDARKGDLGFQSVTSAVSAQGDTGGPPLQRVTQGRTGVVRLARTEPARREAWSIFPQELDPRVRAERGEGHRFEARPLTQDWCDVCSRQMNVEALKCQSMYVHYYTMTLVQY